MGAAIFAGHWVYLCHDWFALFHTFRSFRFAPAISGGFSDVWGGGTRFAKTRSSGSCCETLPDRRNQFLIH